MQAEIVNLYYKCVLNIKFYTVCDNLYRCVYAYLKVLVYSQFLLFTTKQYIAHN